MLRNRANLAIKAFATEASRRFSLSLLALAVGLLLTSCQSGSSGSSEKTGNGQQHAAATSPNSSAPAATKPEASPASSSSAARPAELSFAAVHIKAGDGDSFTDSAGNVWQTDRGFDGGQTIARPDIEIANTKDPQIYRSERYLMDSFSWPVPNGNYLVKLHFAETFEGITAPGERVFAFNVQGRDFNDFDVWTKAGGPLRAYVETVPVTITNGLLKITFTPKVENPQINGIEILPPPLGALK
jgi:hypothetical protein